MNYAIYMKALQIGLRLLGRWLDNAKTRQETKARGKVPKGFSLLSPELTAEITEALQAVVVCAPSIYAVSKGGAMTPEDAKKCLAAIKEIKDVLERIR